MANTKELALATKAIILQKYLDKSDPKPWAIAYSGGKDSTTVVSLVVNALNTLKKSDLFRPVHIVMSDTEIENPLVKDHMHEQVRLIKQYIEKTELPITVTIVRRELKESFWIKTIGKGYFLPQNNGQGRWCTDSLKIKPQDHFLKEIAPSFILTGVRSAESTQRAESIKKWSISEFEGNHISLKNLKTFNPIIKWSIEDVWKYLEIEGLSWGSTLSVRQIYKDSTGECGFTNPADVGAKAVEVCGARHGCWNCPVIMKDQSTEKMSEKYDWLEPLTYMRKRQLQIYGVYYMNRKGFKEINKEIKLITRVGKRRNGQEMEAGQGCLTLDARKYLLNELLETQEVVNKLRKLEGLSPIELITQTEIDEIKKQWEEDLKLKPYLNGNKDGLSIAKLEPLINKFDEIKVKSKKGA